MGNKIIQGDVNISGTLQINGQPIQPGGGGGGLDEAAAVQLMNDVLITGIEGGGFVDETAYLTIKGLTLVRDTLASLDPEFAMWIIEHATPDMLMIKDTLGRIYQFESTSETSADVLITNNFTMGCDFDTLDEHAQDERWPILHGDIYIEIDSETGDYRVGVGEIYRPFETDPYSNMSITAMNDILVDGKGNNEWTYERTCRIIKGEASIHDTWEALDPEFIEWIIGEAANDPVMIRDTFGRLYRCEATGENSMEVAATNPNWGYSPDYSYWDQENPERSPMVMYSVSIETDTGDSKVVIGEFSKPGDPFLTDILSSYFIPALPSVRETLNELPCDLLLQWFASEEGVTIVRDTFGRVYTIEPTSETTANVDIQNNSNFGVEPDENAACLQTFIEVVTDIETGDRYLEIGGFTPTDSQPVIMPFDIYRYWGTENWQSKTKQQFLESQSVETVQRAIWSSVVDYDGGEIPNLNKAKPSKFFDAIGNKYTFIATATGFPRSADVLIEWNRNLSWSGVEERYKGLGQEPVEKWHVDIPYQSEQVVWTRVSGTRYATVDEVRPTAEALEAQGTNLQSEATFHGVTFYNSRHVALELIPADGSVAYDLLDDDYLNQAEFSAMPLPPAFMIAPADGTYYLLCPGGQFDIISARDTVLEANPFKFYITLEYAGDGSEEGSRLPSGATIYFNSVVDLKPTMATESSLGDNGMLNLEYASNLYDEAMQRLFVFLCQIDSRSGSIRCPVSIMYGEEFDVEYAAIITQGYSGDNRDQFDFAIGTSHGIITGRVFVNHDEHDENQCELDWSHYHFPGAGGGDTPFDPTTLPEITFDGTNYSIDSGDLNNLPYQLPIGKLTPNVVCYISPNEEKQFGYAIDADNLKTIYLLDDQFNRLPARILLRGNNQFTLSTTHIVLASNLIWNSHNSFDQYNVTGGFIQATYIGE